jgi:hypothetical protein
MGLGMILRQHINMFMDKSGATNRRKSGVKLRKANSSQEWRKK